MPVVAGVSFSIGETIFRGKRFCLIRELIEAIDFHNKSFCF